MKVMGAKVGSGRVLAFELQIDEFSDIPRGHNDIYSKGWRLLRHNECCNNFSLFESLSSQN